MNQTTVSSTRYYIDAVGRAVQLLRAFLTPPHSFGVTELSQITGLSKNQVFRLLRTLTAEGLLNWDPETKTYTLSYALTELGAVASRGSSLVQAAAPVLDRLAQETGETINLIARADEFTAICIDKRDSARLLQITAKIGARFQLHAGAVPKLLLAFSAPESIERYLAHRQPLQRFTPHTITDPDALRAELAAIRERGYSISDEDLDLGACAIAAPIFDRHGAVIAGVSIAMPASRFGEAERTSYRAAVMAAAAEISRRLGYRAAGSNGQAPPAGTQPR
ncbi:Pectin degradation repressor protein KdgR [bacterium HR26]|nr:Pectin degradation repressor protein KdgR [bacterium HR26]